jgi:hypothetical protein
VAADCDPDGRYRLTPTCSAFSCAISNSYVVEPHDDSGEGPETVQFINRGGRLPRGHEWLFVVGNRIHQLPRYKNGSCVIFVRGREVPHGTLPTARDRSPRWHTPTSARRSSRRRTA